MSESLKEGNIINIRGSQVSGRFKIIKVEHQRDEWRTMLTLEKVEV